MPIYRLVARLLEFLDRRRDHHVKTLVRNGVVRNLVARGVVSPNGLSISRIVISLLVVFYLGNKVFHGWSLDLGFESRMIISFAIAIAALTDLFDGPIARQYAEYFTPKARRFGINLDRHADKLFTLPLLYIYIPYVDLPTKWILGLTIGGDILATILAMIAKRINNPIPANAYGKAKMVMLCLGLFYLVLMYPRGMLVFQLILVSSLTLGAVSLISNSTIFTSRVRSMNSAVATITKKSGEKVTK